ncbi:MAG: RNA pseudouridine synthase [Opitutales bacterium]|nr:RNA pseudouridine synthase [Opitutales bacterium]NRA26404.1 RNA pseudouridine synthase [Opitutales bacterium]
MGTVPDHLNWLLELPLHDRATVLATHPSGLIAIDKGAGLLSHPNPQAPAKKRAATQLAINRGIAKKPKDAASEPVWLHATYDFANEQFEYGSHRIVLCNRLDSATSGVLICCADPELAAEVKRRWAKREVEKIYLAVVRGMVERQSARWTDRLQMSRGGNERGVRVQGRGALGGHPAREPAKSTMRRFYIARTEPRVSLVELSPITGQTHQLRVQSAMHHMPIVGDRKYGDFAFNRAVEKRFPKVRGRMFLHSHKIRIQLDWQGKPIDFTATAPIPKSFSEVLRKDVTGSMGL